MRAGLLLLLAAVLSAAAAAPAPAGWSRGRTRRSRSPTGAPRSSCTARGFEPRPANRAATHAHADRRAAARLPRAVGDAVRALRDRALHRHDRRGDPVGGAQVGPQAGPAARGRDRRVVVADEHGRRQRRLVRALPGAAAVPLHRAGVRAVPRRRGAQRRLLRRHPALLLRRQAALAQHGVGRERQALPARRPVGLGRRVVLGPLVERRRRAATSARSSGG